MQDVNQTLENVRILKIIVSYLYFLPFQYFTQHWSYSVSVVHSLTTKQVYQKFGKYTGKLLCYSHF